jgi:DNA-binding response OmpR family regulator
VLKALTDLILPDVLMPDLNGIIPVLMVTAELEFPADSFELGAIGFINKPIRKIELLARVCSALRLRNEVMTCKRELIELSLILNVDSTHKCNRLF